MSARKHLKAAVKRANKGKHRVVRRWHRRLGLTSALAVALLSITGIMLNHVSSVYEKNEFVSSQWLLDWYGIQPPQRVLSYPLNDSQMLLWADGSLIMGNNFRRFGQSELIGAMTDADLVYAFSRNRVYLFTASGEFVEEVEYRNDATVKDVFTTSERGTVALVNRTQTILLSLDSLTFSQVTDASVVLNKNLNIELSVHAADSSQAQLARQHVLLKSSVLLDLHSGRIFGKFGPWLMDLFAICFLLLAMTGIIAWLRRSPR